jgi:RNA polymerase sigma-70 factor (ECF subfamily)
MYTQPGTVPLNADTIRRAQAGDSEAFGEIFNANRGKVYALCLRMTCNVTEAEDLAQDAFMQAFVRLSTFRGDSALSTWLYRVAVNIVLMHFRKKVWQQVSQDEPLDPDGKTARRECGRNDGRLSGTVNRIALTRALQQLPAGYRMVFLLHDVHGYEHKEIADMLECSTGNSKSQLHKARCKLRQILERVDAPAKSLQTVGSRGSTLSLPPNSSTSFGQL